MASYTRFDNNSCPPFGEKMPAREEVFARILFLGGNSGNSGNKIDL